MHAYARAHARTDAHTHTHAGMQAGARRYDEAVKASWEGLQLAPDTCAT